MDLQEKDMSHSEYVEQIFTVFAARFAQNAASLYIAGSENKNQHIDEMFLVKIGIPKTEHSKLPDVVIYDESKNWLYLIDAVSKSGPMSPKRLFELEDSLKNCTAGKIYVSACIDFLEFEKHVLDIAWDTEVWIMDFPDHMIHFNGDRFLGPR